MKTILNTTKTSTVLLVIIFIFSIHYLGLSKQDKRTSTFSNTKHVLSVSDAKEFAMKSEGNKPIVTIQGVLSGNLMENPMSIFLEDEEPTGLEDVLLYCTFSTDELSAFKLKPGAEITVSGKLNRKTGYVEVTDCKLICINEAVLLHDFTKTEE